MQESTAVRDMMLRFYDRLTAGDVASFEQLVSAQPATLVIGTSPGEWVTERPRLRYGFEAEGVGMTPGPRPLGHQEGTLGWFVDEPLFSFPDGSTMRTRLTAVVHHEADAWKLVHMHVSVAVPDEEVVELQKRWGTA